MRPLLSAVSWLCFALTLIVFLGQLAMVVLRYLLGVGFVELQDAVSYSFAVLVALSVAVAFQADRHVRVDVFRQAWSDALNRRIDLLGNVFLAGPVFGFMLWTAFPLVRSSWEILEGSRETGGLPGLFLVKTALVVLPALMVLLAIGKCVALVRRSAE